MSNATVTPVPIPSSLQGPSVKSLAQQKLKPSAGVEVPPPTRTLNETVAPEMAAPALKSSMTIDPCWLFTALVNLRTPLSPTPPVDSTTASPKTAAPAGARPLLKLAENVAARESRVIITEAKAVNSSTERKEASLI